ncbi:MAG: ABC transporter substrate-binding protein [Promethearchaeota archaeon]|jgi:peptide/nickel transport system substrate-binding protein
MNLEHKKPKKRLSKLKKIVTEKKPLAIGGLIVVISLTGVFGGIYISSLIPEEETFIYGFGNGFNILDPLDLTSEEAFIIIDQVAEGLFDYADTFGETKIIPKLTKSYNWSLDYLNITCTLRENVTFHDGTLFDAPAVKWNIDRILNVPLNTTKGFLWELPDGRWIINKTEIINDYTIKFVLNEPYAPFLSLMSSRMASMFSPASTPEDRYIDITTDLLVGTGPFKYVSCEYIADVIGKLITSVTLRSNLNYWAEKAKIDKLIFKLFSTGAERVDSMISGGIDGTWAPGWAIETFQNTTGLQMVNNTNLIFWYLGMNNKIINLTMRKAISHSFDYPLFVEELTSTRALSPIMPRVQYSKWGAFNVPDYNITIARQILKDIGWNGTSSLIVNGNISSGNEWEQLVINETPLATYNFTYVPGWGYYELLFNLISDMLKQIGVEVIPSHVTFEEYRDMLYHPDLHRHKIELFWAGWEAPDLDPHNSLRLFNDFEPSYNIGQVNDTQIQQWLESAVIEFNETKREDLYSNVQKRLIEELYPVAWVRSGIYFDVFGPNVRGIETIANPHKFVLKGIYFE